MATMKTPKFRIEIWQNLNTSDNPNHIVSWCNGFGEPNYKNLEKFMEMYNSSFQSGGDNYMLSVTAGYIIYGHRARIINQETENVVEVWNAPAFQIF